MNKTSVQPGNATSAVEITHISKHGIWILLGDEEELFMPFRDFPWFMQASIDHVLEVERPAPDHLYWPHLDIDLSIDSIRHPEDYPLIAH